MWFYVVATIWQCNLIVIMFWDQNYFNKFIWIEDSVLITQRVLSCNKPYYTILYLVKLRLFNWLILVTWCRIESSSSQVCNSKILLPSPKCKSTIRFLLLHSFCFSIIPSVKTLLGRWSQYIYTRFSTWGKCDLMQALLFKKELKMARACT